MSGGCLKAWDRASPFERMEEDSKTMAEYKVYLALAKCEAMGCLESAANGLHLALVLK